MSLLENLEELRSSQPQALIALEEEGRVVRIDEAVDENQNGEIFPTGFKEIDLALEDEGDGGGFRDGDLIIVSGRSGNGKTLLTQNFIKNITDNGLPCLFFSYEVKMSNVYKTFKKMGIGADLIIYTPKKNVSGDVEWVKEKIREADKKFFTKFIVIDHLDFLTAKNIPTSDMRRNEINNIITDLKRFAVEENKIIILVAHVTKSKDKPLSNEDIADSRAIGNLADLIFFIGRKEEEGIAMGNEGVIKLSKNRHTGVNVLYNFFVSKNKIIQPYDEFYEYHKSLANEEE